MKKKTLALLLAVVLLVGVAAGGTIAWLTDQTEEVKNVFTVGNINIDLDESDELDLKMVPGKTILKDPVVTVEKGSEACWLFVEVEESNFENYMTYVIADGWNALEGVDGVYYRVVPATTSAEVFHVLKDDAVTVRDTVTKDMMDALEADGATLPTLTFTAYACQKEGIADAATAWSKVNPTSST